jgi:hypothetical protein
MAEVEGEGRDHRPAGGNYLGGITNLGIYNFHFTNSTPPVEFRANRFT